MSLIRSKRDFSLVQNTTSTKLGPGAYHLPSNNQSNNQLSIAPFGSTEPRSVNQSNDSDGPSPGSYQSVYQSNNQSNKQLGSQFASQVDRFNQSNNQSNNQNLGPGSYTIPSTFQSNNQSINQSNKQSNNQSNSPTTVFVERSSTAPSIPSKLDQSIYGYTIDQSNKLIKQSNNQSNNRSNNQSSNEFPAPGQYNPSINLTHPAAPGSAAFGNSKSEREFNLKNGHHWVPGVGAYFAGEEQRDKTTRSSSMFQSVARQPFKPKATPGPGTYDLSSNQSHNQSNNQANFGATKRSEMVDGKFRTPGPGSYGASLPKKPHHQRAQTSSVNQSSRWARDPREGMPGPGSYDHLVDHVQEHHRYHFSTQNSFGTLAPRFTSNKPHTAPGPCDYQTISLSNNQVNNQPINAAHKPVPSAAFHSASRRFTPDEKEPLSDESNNQFDQTVNPVQSRSWKHVNPQIVRPMSSFASSSARFDDFQRVGSALSPNKYELDAPHCHYQSDDIKGASSLFKSVTSRSFDKKPARTINQPISQSNNQSNNQLGPGYYDVNGSSFLVKSFNVTIP